MIINKYNYSQFINQIKAILLSSDIISIDLEFTGTRLIKDCPNLKYDSVEWRYIKSLVNNKQFYPLQIGICGVNFSKDTYSYSPFNFNIFPKDGNIMLDVSSIKFLSSNNFDFNKVIYEGIPYSQIEFKSNSQIEEKIELQLPSVEARLYFYKHYMNIKRLFSNSKDSNDDIIYEIDISKVKSSYIKYFLLEINKYIKSEIIDVSVNINTIQITKEKTILNEKIIIKRTSQEGILNKIELLKESNYNELLTYIYYQSLYIFTSNNKDLIDWWKENLISQSYSIHTNNNMKGMIESSMTLLLNDIDLGIEGFNYEKIEKMIVFLREIKNNQLQNSDTSTIEGLSLFNSDFKLLNRHINTINFSQLIDFILELKKPIVFHNGIIDLFHIYDKFIGDVPYSIYTFSKMLIEKGVILYDTKYIAENSLLLREELEFQSNLERIGSIYKLYDNNYLGDSLKREVSDLIENISLTNTDTNTDRSYVSLYLRDLYIDNLNSNVISNHNAGYDAYLTAKVFIIFYKKLFLNKENQEKDCLIDINKLNKDLKHFKNKLLLSGNENIIDFDYIYSNKHSQNIDEVEKTTVNGLYYVYEVNVNLNKFDLKDFLIYSLGLNPNQNILLTKIYGSNRLIIQIKDIDDIKKINNRLEVSQSKDIEILHGDVRLRLSNLDKFYESVNNSLDYNRI